MNVEKFMRLRSAIQSAMDAVPVGQAAVSGESLPRAYIELRAEARDLVEEADREEFERLFPRWEKGYLPNRDPILVAQHFNEARSLLGRLAGWLDGFIEAAQYQERLSAEAQAYAEARLRAERKTGFQASDHAR